MRTYAALALAAVLSASCKPKVNDHRADAGARAHVRAVPVAVQLAPALDGWRPAATLYTGDDPSTAVVLVHQLGSDRNEWAGLVARLQSGRAVTTLAIDLRGHGESTTGPHDEHVTWESFGTDRERWAGTALDVISAVQYLRTAGARRVVVVGSSIGGSAAVLAATDTLGAYPLPPNATIDGLALLSPGLAYHGLNLREPMQRYLASHRPLLMFAGELDAPSAEAVPALAPGNLPEVEAEVFGAAREHGVSLCNAVPARWIRLDTWIRRTLGILPPPAPVPVVARDH